MRPLLLAAVLLAAGTPLRAEGVPASSGTVGSITFQRKNVFDPSVAGEDWWVFSAANRIHILTRERVIRDELLLLPGRPWDTLAAQETERNLRSRNFIRRAEVRAKPGLGGLLDLEVLTQDAWTLKPQMSVGTEGGDRYLIYGVEENNILGLGKTVSLYGAEVGSERRSEARYADPRVWGTWFQLTGLYSKTRRGDEIGVLLERPFFSLDTDNSTRLAWTRTIQEDKLYDDGAEFSKFIRNTHVTQLEWGFKAFQTGSQTQRGRIGYELEKSWFDPSPETLPGSLPKDRTLSGPVAGWSIVRPDYIQETHIDRIKRVEDFNLGNEFSARGGPALESWGSDKDRWKVSAMDQQGLRLWEEAFLLGQAGIQGRLSGGRAENSLFYANLNFFDKLHRPFSQTLVGHLEYNATGRLDGENQILLGGNTGLRGYKNNSFAGTRSLLLNLEDRFFHDREWFHLLYLGGVAFVDTGCASPGSPARGQWKTDVGFGVRVSPSRSAGGGVLRIDLAYALNPGPGGSRWVLSLRGGQAFSIFNSANRRVLRRAEGAVSEEGAGSRLRRR